MQYTAKLPHSSVLSIESKGLRYRLEKDHHLKEIPFDQVTKVKVKGDFFRAYILCVAPLLVFVNLYLIYLEGFHWVEMMNAVLWSIFLGSHFFIKKNYVVHVIKGPLTAKCSLPMIEKKRIG